MLLVTLTLTAALVTVTAVLGGLLRSQQRAHNRREDLLLNQLLNLAGKPWQPAPADTWEMPAPPDNDDREWPAWTAAPEQEPVFD